jgi:hypothetical protein
MSAIEQECPVGGEKEKRRKKKILNEGEGFCRKSTLHPIAEATPMLK